MSTRCFVSGVQAHSKLSLIGDDAHHIARVLRMRIGDQLVLCDGCGHDFPGTISALDSREVVVEIAECRDNPSELPVRLVLLLAVSRAERFEYALQKSVELGVHEVRPFLSERCVARPEGREERWQRIVLEAARQCGRGMVPTVRPLVSFAAAMRGACDLSRVYFCYEEAREPLRSFIGANDSGTQALGLVTGPEGGFAPFEVEFVQNLGFPVVSLGRRILRCETAPIVALSLIGDWLENNNIQ